MNEHKKPALRAEFEGLAQAIVVQAANDYRSLKRTLRWERSEDERKILQGRMREIELFFKSEYGDILCHGKAALILKRLKEEG